MEASIEHRKESSRVPDSKEAHAAKELINSLLGPLTAMAFSAAVMAGACIVVANIAASGEASQRAWERVKNASDAVKEVKAQQSERASDPATADLLRAAQKRLEEAQDGNVPPNTVWFFVTLAPALVSLFMAGGAIAAKAEWKRARLSQRLAVTSICTAIAGLIAAAPTAAAMSYSGFPAGVSLGLLLSPLSIAVGAVGGTYLGCPSPTNAQRLPLR